MARLFFNIWLFTTVKNFLPKQALNFANDKIRQRLNFFAKPGHKELIVQIQRMTHLMNFTLTILYIKIIYNFKMSKSICDKMRLCTPDAAIILMMTI